MIKILEYNKDNEKSIIEKFQSRTNQFYQQFSNPVPANEKIFGKSLSSVESVRKILEDVEKNGDVSVVKYSKIFDGVDPTPFKVENNLIRNAHQKLSTEIIDALNIAINNVTAYQKRMIGFFL